MARVTVETKPITEHCNSFIVGRNGTWDITAVQVWVSEHSGYTYIDGIGKRGSAIRGGLRVHQDTMDKLGLAWCKERRLVPGLSAADVEMARKQTEEWMRLGEELDDPATAKCDVVGIFWARRVLESALAALFMQVIGSLEVADEI